MKTVAQRTVYQAVGVLNDQRTVTTTDLALVQVMATIAVAEQLERIADSLDKTDAVR